MLDQLFEIYSVVFNFILGIDYYEYMIEISGFLSILLLLLILRRIRKQRKIKKEKLLRTVPKEICDIEVDHYRNNDIAFEESILQEAEEPVEVAVETLADELPEDFDVQKDEPDSDTPSSPLRDESPVLEEEAVVVESLPEKPIEPVGFLDRLKSGLSKTRQTLSNRFDAILSGNRKLDDDVLEEIEEVLITSDIGVPTTMELMERIEKQANKISNADEFKSQLKKEMLSLVDIEHPALTLEKPHIIMVVGVNGVGKTTTIGKLAAKFSGQGKKVLLSAADTFRAAAVEQLEIWADRSNADIVKHRDKSDPAAVAYDSVEAGIARDVDMVIVDTAGRLQTKVNLMEELKKIRRSIGKRIPSAPHETLLVLDATTGQNAVSQAKLFNETTDITGIVLTKLDGTAKGGIVLSICNTLNVPIRYIGIGEGIDDLQEFDPKLFVDALL